MSIYLFPKNFCHKIDALLRTFWWGANDNGNCLNLKSWDVLCSPKSVGGMGFRRLFDLNFALMAKLAWNICIDDDAIWISILKAKYMRGINFLADNLHHSDSSWIWLDLIKCRDLIVGGALYQVSSNSDILIWKDPWIPSIKNFHPDINSCSNTLSLSLVNNLIDNRSNNWDLNILKATFPSDIVKEICKIQISFDVRPKHLIWSPSKSGIFSSKSAYIFSQSNRFYPVNPPARFKWSLIWSSRLHNS
ncbi:hypothetical protein CASFOL_018935 [Castilleja foliolosa]|uniref:Uncharacterized protein n=1 Tax=Castilleja foliolosa TaxID=1961234 RepID=A0ABD3D2Y8_9LAMI